MKAKPRGTRPNFQPEFSDAVKGQANNEQNT